jgi:hypothetical protein
MSGPVIAFTDEVGRINLDLLRQDTVVNPSGDWTYYIQEKFAHTGRPFRPYWDTDDITADFVDLFEIGPVPASSGTPIAQGPPGPAGPPGPEGPPGPAGASSTGYTHTEAAPTETWIIVHNLGYRPSGLIVKDNGGALNSPEDIDWPDENTMRLFFPNRPFSGTAWVS